MTKVDILKMIVWGSFIAWLVVVLWRGRGFPPVGLWLAVAGLAALLCFGSGCAAVPATKIRFNPATEEVRIESPKDTEMKGLFITISNGIASIRIESYSSRNNVEVIQALAKQNAATAKALAETAGAAIGEAASKLK